MAHKEIFAANLKRYMALNGKSRKEVCEALGYSYFTFSDWVNGKKMPRMDKVEQLANYFGILKSDLIEDKTEMQKNNDAITDIIVRLRTDKDYLDVCSLLKEMEPNQITSVRQMLVTFLK